ncbi:MAG: hypothetical protein N4A45_03950 [Flavobacteriales bacterium]|jgi:hypothetical protein|nr:hypothetical protein [Flavobacteriales bacterium]
MNKNQKNKRLFYPFILAIMAFLMWNINSAFDQKTEEVVDAIIEEDFVADNPVSQKDKKVTFFINFVKTIIESKVRIEL